MLIRPTLIAAASAISAVAALASAASASAVCPEPGCGTPPPPQVVEIVGTQAGVTLEDFQGFAPRSASLAFTNPVGEPPVTFTATGSSSLLPVRVVASDTLGCSGGQVTTVAHDSAAVDGRATITWQPNLSCPAGQYPVWSTQSGHGQAGSTGTPTAQVSFSWAWIQ